MRFRITKNYTNLTWTWSHLLQAISIEIFAVKQKKSIFQQKKASIFWIPDSGNDIFFIALNTGSVIILLFLFNSVFNYHRDFYEYFVIIWTIFCSSFIMSTVSYWIWLFSIRYLFAAKTVIFFLNRNRHLTLYFLSVLTPTYPIFWMYQMKLWQIDI